MNKIIIDTETTGFYPETAKIVELAAIEINNKNEPTGMFFHSYINPKKRILKDVKNIIGLDNKFLKQYPEFNKIKDVFLNFIDGKEIVLYNAKFNLSFLNNELGFELKNKYTDVLDLAKEIFPDRRHSITPMCKLLNIEETTEYNSSTLSTCLLISKIYKKLLKQKNSAK